MNNETPKPPSKFARARKWTVEHADVLFIGTVVVGFAGLITAAAMAEVKQINEANAWTAEQTNGGRNVYELSNGALLAVDRTADINVRI